MTDVFIVDAVRTAIGRRNGALAGVRADDLAAAALQGLVQRIDLDPAEVEDVQMGCVTQVGEQALNVGRVAALVAGWPETVAATTVDRQCGSSLQAAFNAHVFAEELRFAAAFGINIHSENDMADREDQHSPSIEWRNPNAETNGRCARYVSYIL